MIRFDTDRQSWQVSFDGYTWLDCHPLAALGFFLAGFFVTP
jgi:hypothetical protein